MIYSNAEPSRCELIKQLLVGTTNDQLHELIEYKITLMAAQLAKDIAMLASKTIEKKPIEEP